MTVSLGYSAPDGALRGVRLVAFVLLLVSAAVWLLMTGVFVAGIAAVFLLFHAGTGRAGPAFPLWAYGVLFLEFLVPVGFTAGYTWTAFAIKRASRAGAITAVVVVILNVLLALVMIVGAGSELVRTSVVDPGVIIVLVLGLAALAYLVTLLVFLVRTLRAGGVQRAPGFVPSAAEVPLSPGGS
jgi:hypothetical protein